MQSVTRFLKAPAIAVFAAACLCLTPNAKANVYATNIKLNGSLANATAPQGTSVTISYILNEAATTGVTIKVLSGSTIVRTINIASGNPGTAVGTNSVAWDGKNDSNANVPPGNYSVSITAAATGYADWTQTSVDNQIGPGGITNHFAYFPYGLDVDRNTNSPYYGRIVLGNAASANNNSPFGARRGLYKCNADGSPADEGWYGNAGYLTNDYGIVSSNGEMPAGKSTGHKVPGTIRIGEDDRIYFMDASQLGAVVATDIKATTNQTVITSGTVAISQGGGNFDFSHLLCQSSPATTSVGCGGPNNYQDCPLVTELDQSGTGLQQFDVCGLGTTNAAMYLVDSGDFPSWGVWCFRFDTNAMGGLSDTNETQGCQVIYTGGDPVVTGAGIMVDYNLDIFVSSTRQNPGDALHRCYLWTNWGGNNGGISGSLPPENSTFNTTFGNGGQDPTWQVGSADDYMTSIWDTAIDSRANPKLVAVAMAAGAPVAGGYTGLNGGIRIVSAVDGSIVKTNVDLANWYNSVAFDNVGNVYGASRSNNRWRSWSPPGANTNTTTAVFSVQVTAAATPVHITNINYNNGVITINFTGDTSDAPTSFTLQNSGVVQGPYNNDVAVATQNSPGSFTFTTAASGTTQFYRISR